MTKIFLADADADDNDDDNDDDDDDVTLESTQQWSIYSIQWITTASRQTSVHDSNK